MTEDWKIIPTHEELEPSLGVHQISVFHVGPIPIIFKIIDTSIHPDIIWSGVKFEKRYLTAVDVCQTVWAWHASDDLDNVKSFTNYIMNEFKIGKRIVVSDALGVREPIGISYDKIEIEVRTNSSE